MILLPADAPQGDGITHINVYSKAKTQLGRILSNFYRYEIQTPYGIFASIEAYWHYLGIKGESPEKERLRSLSGNEALFLGRRLKKIYGKEILPKEEFETLIIDAVRYKFLRHQRYLRSEYFYLPMYHYMVNHGKAVAVSDQYSFFIEGIIEIRDSIRDGMIL